jgi:hypothetical protein
MKNARTGLYIAVLMSLFFFFAPCLIHAQEQDPVPWPCRAMDMAGRSIPYPCDAQSETEVLVAQSFDAILANSVGFGVKAGIAAESDGANATLPISREIRREEFAFTGSRWARASLQPDAVRTL